MAHGFGSGFSGGLNKTRVLGYNITGTLGVILVIIPASIVRLRLGALAEGSGV